MILKEGKLRLRVVHVLHRLAFLRRWAKRICRGWVIRQSFYGGTICLDAIEHSWAWTGQNSYEKFDRPLQEELLRRSIALPVIVITGHGDVPLAVRAMTAGAVKCESCLA